MQVRKNSSKLEKDPVSEKYSTSTKEPMLKEKYKSKRERMKGDGKN